MAQCINLTFKNNDEEILLYLEAASHSSKGNYIKDCMKFFKKYGHLEKQMTLLLNEENRKVQ